MSKNYSLTNAPEGYAEAVVTMDDDELREELLKCSVTAINTKNALSLDKDVVAAQAKVDTAKKGLENAQKKYLDVIAAEDAKAQYCTRELSRRGFKGHTTEIDQLSFEDLEKMAAEDKKEEASSDEGAKPTRKTRRTSPKSSAK